MVVQQENPCQEVAVGCISDRSKATSSRRKAVMAQWRSKPSLSKATELAKHHTPQIARVKSWSCWSFVVQCPVCIDDHEHWFGEYSKNLLHERRCTIAAPSDMRYYRVLFPFDAKTGAARYEINKSTGELIDPKIYAIAPQVNLKWKEKAKNCARAKAKSCLQGLKATFLTRHKHISLPLTVDVAYLDRGEGFSRITGAHSYSTIDSIPDIHVDGENCTSLLLQLAEEVGHHMLPSIEHPCYRHVESHLVAYFVSKHTFLPSEIGSLADSEMENHALLRHPLRLVPHDNDEDEHERLSPEMGWHSLFPMRGIALDMPPVRVRKATIVVRSNSLPDRDVSPCKTCLEFVARVNVKLDLEISLEHDSAASDPTDSEFASVEEQKGSKGIARYKKVGQRTGMGKQSRHRTFGFDEKA